VVFLLKILVVFVRLFSELFVETCARLWLLFCESRFDRGGQLSEPPMHNMKGNPRKGAVCGPTSVVRLRPPRLDFDQVSASQVSPPWPIINKGS